MLIACFSRKPMLKTCVVYSIVLDPNAQSPCPFLKRGFAAL